MSLSELVELPAQARRPNLVIDLSSFLGDGKAIEFREPTLGDLYPDQSLTERLRISFPLMHNEHIAGCIIMGRCYVKNNNESGQDTIRTMCTIFDKNPRIYLHIARQFNAEFMTVYTESLVESKNALTE
jgi:hypothetical protein